MRPPFSSIPSPSPSFHHRFNHLFSSLLTFRWVHTIPTDIHPKIIVIMGATGAGKSRLSIDLATRFFKNSEIINSDKMQVYRGLDITTNKITVQQQQAVPHHLLGVFDPTRSLVTPHDFRKHASKTISDIISRRGLPVVVGGSNSFIYSLLTKRFNPESDVFKETDPDPVSSELRFNCCFIWVDVWLQVLNRYLSKRVGEMLDSGMVEELEEYFGSGKYLTVKGGGLGQAIGVPELEGYFTNVDEAYDNGVRRIKDNTCQLAKRQVGKILRLKEGGWDLKRIDATEVFRAEEGGGRVAEIWETEVVEPSVKIVNQFLNE